MAAGVAGDAHHARHRLRHQVKARPVGPGPGLAEARDAGVDQARVGRAQVLVAQPQPPQRAGAVVLQQDVGVAREPQHHRAAGLGLEVQRHAALVAVHVEKAERVVSLHAKAHRAAGLVAGAGRFDLDDVRAQVAQQHAGVRPGHDLGDVEDLDAGKGENV
jgi:hypothetical protein